MIKRTIGITCTVGLLALLPGCSSSEDSTPSSGGTGTTTGGTGPSTGGSGGSGTTTGGSGGSGTTTGGSAGTGSGGVGVGGSANPVECQGISRNMPCPTEGTNCPGLKCGLCDSGTRDCACTGGVWMCSSCDFSASEFMTMPTDAMACTSQADEVACDGMSGTVCTGAAGGEVCGCCSAAFADGVVWDCDDPPSTWAQ